MLHRKTHHGLSGFYRGLPSHFRDQRRRFCLACIARKSLEICEQSRLWQRSSLATPENSAALCVIFAG